MKTRWQNKEKNRCVICGKILLSSSYWTCKECDLGCDTKTVTNLSNNILEIKSVCCGTDVSNNQSITCSTECHNVLVGNMEKEFGYYKKILDIESNLSYKVPTRDIIEKGLTHDDLLKYPRWG